MGKPDHSVIHLPARKEVQFAYSDHSKAKGVFGEYPQTGLREGAQKMALWARAGGAQQSKPFEGVEISRNLPSSWLPLLK